MKGEPYRRITPTALARNAPPLSGLRPASSTFYGIAATGSYTIIFGWVALRTRAVHIFLLHSSIIPSFVSLTWANSTVESSFYYNYCNLVMFSIDFFSHSFQNLWKRIPIPPKHCFSMCLFHTPIQKTPQDFHCLWSFSRLFLSSSDFNPFFGIWKPVFLSHFPEFLHRLFKHCGKIFAAGEGVWKTGKGPSAGFFPGFGPFEVDFLLFFTGCNRFSTWFIHSCGNSCG